MENSTRVLGVLSGGDLDWDLLAAWARSADRVYAADAGADLLMRVGAIPHLVVGDMDSITVQALEAGGQIEPSSDQDTTDCEKLLAKIALEGHPAVTLIGVEGDLPDHVLATLHAAASFELDVRLAYRRGIGWIVKREMPRQLPTVPGRRVSLLPIEPCVGASLTGVHWEVSGADLSPRGLRSISNSTVGTEVRAKVKAGAALLFLELPRDELPAW